MGKTAVFQNEEKAIFASYLIRINLDKKIILPKYYWYFTKSREYWEQVNNLTKGTIQPQFNANSLKEITVLIPNLEEQDKLISKWEKKRLMRVEQQKLINYCQEEQKESLDNLW